MMNDEQARGIVENVFRAALDAAMAGPAVLRHLPEKPQGRCIVVGAGKASAAMAAAVDAAWPDVALTGVIATRYGHAVEAGRIAVFEAGHPVPDENSVRAARRMLEAVRGLGPDDLVLALVSGGGSASLALPMDGMDLAGKQAVTRALLNSGAPIGEINTVRRHLSGIKGGRLAAAARPARVVTLLISDVPGDDPAAIASGPTLADSSTPADAVAILERHGIPVPQALRNARPAPSPADNGECHLVATPSRALDAAAARGRALGCDVVNLGDALEGEAADLGRELARDALERGRSAAGPLLLLSGGETTVTIGPEGAGEGGRNCEFLLSLAVAFNGASGVFALAADTDGIDGTSDAAGAFVTPSTLARAQALGLDPVAALARHDSYTLFAALGDLVVTGPTHTNVNDFRAVLVG